MSSVRHCASASLFQGRIWTRWKVQLLCQCGSECIHHRPALLPAWEWKKEHPCRCQDLLSGLWSPHGGVLWSAGSEKQRRNLQPGWAAGGGIGCLHCLEQRESQRFKKAYFVLLTTITWKCWKCIHYTNSFVAAVISHKPKDVMLGTVKIPLADLVHKRTGMLHSLWLLDQIDFLICTQSLCFFFQT